MGWQFTLAVLLIAQLGNVSCITDSLLNSIEVKRKGAPAADTTFSSIMMLPMSSAPECKQIWAVCFPTVNHEGLDVFHIREHDATDGDHADVFISRTGVSCTLEFLQQGAVIHERPWNESEKSNCTSGFSDCTLRISTRCSIRSINVST
jgi:hypothetical protein